MKKILLLVDKIGRKKEALALGLQEYLGGKAKVYLARFSDVVMEIEGRDIKIKVEGKNINEFSLVYFRRVGHNYLSIAGSLALCLDQLGIEYFDTKFREIGAAGDKFTSLAKLSIGGIPVPHTIFLWKKHIPNYAGEILKRLGNPVIAKDCEAQRNTRIFILRDQKDFKQLSTTKIEKQERQFLFQKFIDIDKEFRLLVLGDRVAVVHTKAVRNYTGFQVVDDTPADNFIFIDPKEIPDQLKKLAVAAARRLGVEVAGVDAAIEKRTGRNYVFEVNRGPGFLYDPTRSPELAELAKFLAKELRSKNG